MDRFFNRKRKKSPEPPQQLGISTGTITGPGFRAGMDIDPKGGRNRSYQDLEVDRVDLTMILDERDSRGPRVVFQDESGGGQNIPAPGASTFGVLDVDSGHGSDPIGRCS